MIFDKLHIRFPENKILDIKNGYKWIYFDKVNINETNLNVGVCFKNERIYEIHFTFTKLEQPNQNECSIEPELMQKRIYENWLTAELGKKRKFKWGKIGALYDPRSEFAFIFLKYN